MNLSETQLSILKLIDLHGEISRKQLAIYSGLSQPAVTNITKELLDQKYILEGKETDSAGRPGRKEVLLYSNADRFRFLGIDIGGYWVRFAISDNKLNIFHQSITPMREFINEPDKLAALTRHINVFLQEHDIAAESIDAIGVGVTGIINMEKTHILNIPNLADWDDLPVVSVLQNAFHCPVFLEEGGRTMALAERLVGKAKNVDNFIVVNIGKGIVAGMMLSKQLIYGASNVGGLLGHVTVDETGKQCLCGNYGCLEMFGPYQMIEEKFEALDHSGISLEEAYQQNNKAALTACIEAGHAIGIALSNVVNLLNPQHIYLGGRLFETLPLVFEELKRTIQLRANRFANVVLSIEKTSFGDMEGLYGALTLAKSELIHLYP